MGRRLHFVHMAKNYRLKKFHTFPTFTLDYTDIIWQSVFIILITNMCAVNIKVFFSFHIYFNFQYQHSAFNRLQ